MVEVLNQLLPIREWNETFSRDELCVLLDFCHLSLKHPGTNSQNQEPGHISTSSDCS